LRGARPAESAERRIPRWAIAVLAVIALVAAATGARAFQANRDAWSSEESTHFGDQGEALTFADRAAARDGGRADHWNRLGLALAEIAIAFGRCELALSEATRAASLEPGHDALVGRAQSCR